MANIDELLNEAEHGKKGNYVEDRITPEAEPFWIALKDRIIKKKIKMRPYVVHRLLHDEFGIEISESAIRRYLQKLERDNNV
tara:strand:- start:4766 stop:5011 length:246 start_codon:yes stop_codon:yes gene_type:complete